MFWAFILMVALALWPQTMQRILAGLGWVAVAWFAATLLFVVMFG